MATSIVFMGGKEIGYHCLNFLLSNSQSLNCEVTAVLSSGRMLFEPDLSINDLCAQHKVPVPDSLDAFLNHPAPDLIVSVQYHEILKERHIAHAKRLAVNLHMAPLPEYRGCNQFSFAILDGASEFGTTIHRLEPGIDSGDLIAETRFPIAGDATARSLYQDTYEHSLALFGDAIASIIGDSYSLTTQESLVAERGTSYHFRHEINDIKVCEPSWPAERIKRHIRATWFPPFEPPYMMVDGQKTYLSPDWQPGK